MGTRVTFGDAFERSSQGSKVPSELGAVARIGVARESDLPHEPESDFPAHAFTRPAASRRGRASGVAARRRDRDVLHFASQSAQKATTSSVAF